MKKIRLKVSQFFWLIPPILLLFSFIEVDFSQFITEKLNKFKSTYPQEKVFLHIDKPYYAQGDTLWFKAYLVEGAFHMPDTISTLLYVDLVDQKTGDQVAVNRVQMHNGLGNGDFVLNNTIPSGAYTIRSYTRWMTNFSTDFFFQKPIFIFNNTVSESQKVDQETFDLQFFPEGGQLVDGLSTRIAFKAVGKNGLGVDISGFVLNQKGDTLSGFKSDHLGMGRMSFLPDKNVGYKIIAKTATSKYQEIPFPKIEPYGQVMIVDNVSFRDKIRILIYNKSQEKGNMELHLVGHARGILAFSVKVTLSERGVIMNLPSAELPDGITHLTLFDNNTNPICERLVFVDNNRSLQVQVKPDKAIYKAREETKVVVAVKDAHGEPVTANLSVSVIDLGQVASEPLDENIKSYFLLSSDLKGYVEQPAYYFDSTKSDRKIYLDYVMATHGWSRFSWKNVLQDSLESPKRNFENGITLAGTVLRGNRKLKEAAILSIILSKDSLSSFFTTETDVNGNFMVLGLNFTDSLTVRLQGMNKKGNQSLTFHIDDIFVPPTVLMKIPYYPITVESEQLKNFLKEAAEYQEIERTIRANREKLLDVVTIKGHKTVEHDSRKLYSNADASVKVTPQMAGSAQTILDLLAGRVAGVQVQGSGQTASVFIRGSRSEPQFVLDGMPVDKDMILNMSVFDVETIDVLKGASAAIYGSRGGNGVISILTKRANANYDYSKDEIPGVLVSKIKGYDVPREFYAPKYEVNTPLFNRPDYRSTIYWKPNLETNSNGKAQFKYFNTDAHSRVLIRVEVLSNDGLTGSERYSYQLN